LKCFSYPSKDNLAGFFSFATIQCLFPWKVYR
jgi:hypothetical protein